MRIVPLQIESRLQAASLMAGLRVSREGIKILANKALPLAFRIDGIKSWAANIIKQHMLSLGSDAAIERAALLKDIKTSVLVFGSQSQFSRLCEKLANQPFGLKEAAEKISACLDNRETTRVLRCRDKVLRLKAPIVCAIMNLTPDSFSGDGLISRAHDQKTLIDLALAGAEGMIKNGAKIIDIGGESSRPFSKPVKEAEEIRRVIPAVKAIRKEFRKIIISVDTYKYAVAKEAAFAGADIINDITALRHSPKIAQIIVKHKLGCVLMHMRGMPATMQVSPYYQDVMAEVMDFFDQRLRFVRQQGIKESQVMVDPGIGFGKRRQDNLQIIKNLYQLRLFGLPVFVGLSRKSFISSSGGCPAGQRLSGSLAAAVLAAARGADIVRAHDVRETAQALKIASAILDS